MDYEVRVKRSGILVDDRIARTDDPTLAREIAASFNRGSPPVAYVTPTPPEVGLPPWGDWGSYTLAKEADRQASYESRLQERKILYAPT